MKKTLRLILGDQLNSVHSWFKKTDNDIIYVMMEMMQEQNYVMHHIQKILGFFNAMRSFSASLEKDGHKVIYLKLDDKNNLQKLDLNLDELIKEHQITRFEYLLPDEYRLDQQLNTYCKNLKIDSATFDTEHFLTGRFDVKEFFAKKKTFLMENFYRDMRKKHHILIDHDAEPVGGKWNFDIENRKKYDGKVPLKKPQLFNHDVSALKKIIDKQKVKYFGEVDEQHFTLPQNRQEALKILEFFCKELLPFFGTYEDAMLQQHQTLFHSRLSFSLNTKMISPYEVVNSVIKQWEANQKLISIAQVEGFIRQVIGWREYMRGIYWAKMPDFADMNYFDHQLKLPNWFWDGKVKMNCLNHCINDSLQNGWAHHIQRLMVIGNFALLAGCNPDEVDDWYLGVYVDAIQWVEITNTRGMSQFADGGIVGSKPYVSSANYIDKMSNYCKTCAYDKSKKYGENACPFNALYWDFYHRNEAKLAGNRRVSMMVNLLNKMDKSELSKILDHAETIKQNINAL